MIAPGRRIHPRAGLLAWLLALLAISASSVLAGDGDHPVEAVYLANEGFLLSGPEGQVLIDALFRGGVDGYDVIPEEQRLLLEAAREPYDRVELVLATHFHDDHFDPQAVAAHLHHNPRAVFVSTNQAVVRLRSETDGFEKIEDRVRAAVPEEGERIAIEHGGIEIEVVNLHHGRRRPIENLGFLVNLGGKRFLHIGDTVADVGDFQLNDLAADGIDVALVPYWQLISSNRMAAIEDGIAAQQVVAIHVPVGGSPLARYDGDPSRLFEELEAFDPPVLIVRRPLDTLNF